MSGSTSSRKRRLANRSGETSRRSISSCSDRLDDLDSHSSVLSLVIATRAARRRARPASIWLRISESNGDTSRVGPGALARAAAWWRRSRRRSCPSRFAARRACAGAPRPATGSPRTGRRGSRRRRRPAHATPSGPVHEVRSRRCPGQPAARARRSRQRSGITLTSSGRRGGGRRRCARRRGRSRTTRRRGSPSRGRRSMSCSTRRWRRPTTGRRPRARRGRRSR